MVRLATVIVVISLVGCSASPRGNTANDEHNPQPVLSQPPMSSSDESEAVTVPELVNPVDQSGLINIPSGEFQMGELPEVGLEICKVSRTGCSLEDFRDENPPHEVYLDEYWIYKTEVTNGQFRLCVDSGYCSPPQFAEFYDNPLVELHPVVYVRWFDSEEYCEWAGGRLPTEAEWEKAARGENGGLFPWGDEVSCGYANLKGCSRGLTEIVGSYPEGASPFGVLDMAGNAAEWVADWYAPNYYSGSDLKNPTGPETGELKVARGGSWKNPYSGARTTNRSANFPDIASSGVGFRCVLEVMSVVP